MSKQATLTNVTGDGRARPRGRKPSESSRVEELGRALAAQATGAGHVQFEALLDAMRPVAPIPAPPVVVNALRNAELRTLFLERVGAFTSTEVARIAGSGARNQHAIASRWRAQGRVLGVPWGEAMLFPAFQFTDDGQPHPSMARVLPVFADRAGPWEVALWFVLPSPHLPGGDAPIAHLDEPDLLADAARAEVELPEF